MHIRSALRTVLAIGSIAVLLGSAGSAQQAAARPSKGNNDHTARQSRPIQLGVSGGNSNDLANGYCCSGTLGALVTNGSKQFILSNTHVFAGDAVLGGNGKVASIGDDINQSGLIDVGCQVIPADMVADLSEWAPFGQF